MSCWRILELAEQPNSKPIPQLLVKPVFHSDSYIVHLTDLSNIWSEELDFDGIVDRASKEQSPIEVSKQDTAQLAILLENVKKPLGGSEDAICRITRDDADGVTLHTTISLPEPLDSLTWEFHLEKRTSTTLKNELILPLLVSSHIQHERITNLISTIAHKDKAITRLVDQYESNNLDLATAFPSVGSLKAGRKMIKREQAARHVPALQPFREEAWREETEQLEDSDVTTLGLFQEALAQSTPKVPAKLKSEERGDVWWTAISNRLSLLNPISKSEAKKPAPAAKIKQAVVESSDDETEDEFETHDKFKTRSLASKPVKVPEPAPLAKMGHSNSEGDSTEDDEDLDALPKSRSQRQRGDTRVSPPRTKSPTSEESPPPKASTPPVTKPKAKGFRIGGRARKANEHAPSPREDVEVTPGADALPSEEFVPPSSPVDSHANTTPRKARKPFKIGGKGKAINEEGSECAITGSLKMNRIREAHSLKAEPPSSPPSRAVKEETLVEEVYEETAEEKVERKRAELKRKNEEAAKKQAQHKKKKRF